MKRAVVLMSILLFAPTAAFAAFDVDLEYGMRGSEVVKLQEFLASEGFFDISDATGNFYGLTLAAVKRYQAVHSIPSTGYVGPLTRARIRASLGQVPVASTQATPIDPGVKLPPTASDASLAALQDKLAVLLQQIQALQGSAPTAPALSAAGTPALAPFDFDPAWRDAVVNLLCTNRHGSINNLISGSGIIIDPRGVVLTNAHVAHAFLFADWPDPSIFQCSIRIGSPAMPRYKATLLYIPDEWMREQIVSEFTVSAEDKTVYGQDDYALLLITGPTSETVQMPNFFPYLPLYLDGALPAKSSVYLSGYPAESYGGEKVQRDLYQVSSPSQVGELRVFPGGSLPSVITFNGNIAAQHGSSGGAVIAQGGALAGLITFLDKDYGRTTAERVLNAITTEYISRDLKGEIGVTLPEFLAVQDLIGTSHNFMTSRGAHYQNTYADLWKSKGFAVPGL